jgi:apolipoprotein N-acyltransferase
MFLANPPAGLWPLAFVALAPFLWLVRASRPRRGLLLGLVFGFVYFGALLYWIRLFGELAWGSLSLVSAGYVAVFGLLAPVLWRGRSPVRSAVALAALWTALEYVRGMFPLGGFTWGGLGYSQVDNPWLLPLASVTGVWGISFVVVLFNALILLVLHRVGRRNLAAGGLALAGAILVVGAALIPIPEPDGRAVDVAAIQVDVPKGLELDPLLEDRVIAEKHAALHRTLSADPPDLVVWAENSLDRDPTRDPELGALVEGAIREVGVPTVVGAITRTNDGRSFNENLLYDGDGTLIGRYAKQHLVPFGEFVPWRGALGWIDALRQIERDLSPGPRPAGPFEVNGMRFSTVICFENIFAPLDRRLVADGARFLVVTTNNASYLRTAASEQHVAMSRMRAVENGRWVVHAAISGISAFVDPSGRVVEESELFEPTVVRGVIRESGARTPYTRFGDWFAWAALLGAVGLLLLPRRRDSADRATTSLPDHPRTLVILPTYNEKTTVGEVLARVLSVAPEVDVLVVDDGSPDGTGAIVRELAREEPRISLLERPRKSGLASAYVTGFRRAIDEGYDLVVEMDADLSHAPEELPALLDAAGHYDLTIGSRYVPGGSVTNWGLIRRALSRGGNGYARLALGFPVTDATSGFRVFRTPLLRYLLRRRIHSDGYAFQIEMAYRSWWAGFAVGEVPITFREREHGHSKISRRIVLEALWLVFVWGLRDRLRVPPPGPQPRVADPASRASAGQHPTRDAP